MKKVIVAHDIKPLLLSSIDVLQRTDTSVLPAATGDEILKLHITENANLIVTRDDLPGLSCETLIHTIRRGENMRAVSVMLLCGNEANRERYSRCGANAVVAWPTERATLSATVHELLNVAPRRHYRIVLNVAVDGKRNNRPFIGSSRNVSRKGILIRSAERLDQGDHLACSFFLPDGKRISAAGEVVRTVDGPETGSDARSYGIRFLSIAPDAEAAIAAFVDKDRKQGRRPPGEEAAA